MATNADGRMACADNERRRRRRSGQEFKRPFPKPYLTGSARRRHPKRNHGKARLNIQGERSNLMNHAAPGRAR